MLPTTALRAYVTSMPYLITLRKECGVFFIPVSVGVRKQTDGFHNNSVWKFKQKKERRSTSHRST